MDRYIVTATFHVRVYPDGPDKPGQNVGFAKSQVIGRGDIPDGFDPEQWIADGLLKRATTTDHETAAG